MTSHNSFPRSGQKLKLFNNVELEQALNLCKKMAEKGFNIAALNIEQTAEAIKDAEGSIRSTLKTIESSTVHSPELLVDIRGQLNKLVSDLYGLQRDAEQKLQEKKKHLAYFNISLFGRTMTGKSTLMEILTKGNGASIGRGAQRTTRDVRSYTWKGLKITDVPGIAAFEGAEDEKVAFDAASQADLVLFLITDDCPQDSEALCLAQVKKLGKPILGICNVKVATDDPDDLMLFLDDPDQPFNEKRLNDLKGQFLALVHQYLPDVRIPFVYIHANSRFLADQHHMEFQKDALLKASRFAYFEKRLIHYVVENGRFSRLKTFIDASVVPMMALAEQLMEFSSENTSSGRVLKAKFEQLLEWVREFSQRNEVKINGFANTVLRSLQAEIPSFAESNYANSNAGAAWNNTIKTFNIEEKSTQQLKSIHKEYEDFLKAFLREISTELSLVSSLNIETFSMSGITDIRKIARWTFSSIAGGLSLAALILSSGPLGWAAAAVGLIGVVFSWFTSSRDSKVAKARAELEVKLEQHATKLKDHLRKQMLDWFQTELMGKQIKSLELDIQAIITTLFSLANTQRNLADILMARQLNLNRILISELLTFIDMAVWDKKIVKVARVPGVVVALLIEPGTVFPDGFKSRLESLIGERVLFVINDKNNWSILNKLLRRKLGDQVHIRIDERSRVAHVSNLNDEECRSLALLGQQLTGLYVTI